MLKVGIVKFILLFLFISEISALPIDRNSVETQNTVIAQAATRRNTTSRRNRATRRTATRRRTAVRTRRNNRRTRNRIKTIQTIEGSNVMITLKRKNVDGNWSVEAYNRELLELVENRRGIRNTYFIFKPIKKGVAVVKIIFKNNRGIRDREIYKVKIGSQQEYRNTIANLENRTRANRNRRTNRVSRQNARTQRNRNENTRISLNNSSSDNRQSAGSDASQPHVASQEEKTSFALLKNLFDRKAYKEVVAEAQRFMSKYQTSMHLVDVIILAGKAHGFLNQHNRAIDLFTKYIRKVKNPTVTYPVYFARAKSFEKLKKFSNAQVEYIKMLTIFKNKPELVAKTHLLLGKLYLKKKNMILGLNELEKLVRRYPNHSEITAEAYYNLGNHYYKTRGIENYEKSYRSFKKLAALFPESRFAELAKRMARYLKVNYIDYR